MAFGNIYKHFIFSFYGISAYVDWFSAKSCANAALGIVICTTFPLWLTNVWKYDFFTNYKWTKYLYMLLAVPIIKYAVDYSKIYAHSHIDAMSPYYLSSMFLVTSFALLKKAKNRYAVWMVMLVYTSLMVGLDINASTQSRNAFPIATYIDGDYAQIISIDGNMYLVKCHIDNESDNTTLVIDKGRTKFVTLDKIKQDEESGSHPFKTIKFDNIIVK